MTPQEKYNEDVEYNIGVLKSGDVKKYYDPDRRSARLCEEFNPRFYMGQDGLCGIKEIINHSKDIVKDYKIIRENQFDLLVWPKHKMNINVMRYMKYRDRIDLLLIDINRFYQFTKGENKLTEKLKSDILNGCDLGRAYVHPYTFEWLKSFKNFEGFVKSRNLGRFIEKNGDEPIEWEGCGAGFTQEYYDKMISKMDACL